MPKGCAFCRAVCIVQSLEEHTWLCLESEDARTPAHRLSFPLTVACSQCHFTPPVTQRT